MMFRTHRLPFVVTLLAMPLSWVVSYTSIGVLTWAPEVVALLAFVIVAVGGRLNPPFTRAQLALVCVAAALLIIHLLRGQGIGASAITSVILMSLLFLAFFQTAPPGSFYRTLLKQISVIYAIHVGFILVEILLLNTGRTNILMTLSAGQYKAGLPGLYAIVPQALSQQSQAASQFSLFAAIWFAMRYLSRRALGVRFGVGSTALFFASAAVFAFYPTTTMAFVGAILLTTIAYCLRFTKRRSLRFGLPLVFLLLLPFNTERLPLPAKIYDDTVDKMNVRMPSLIVPEASVYEVAVLHPVDLWLQLPLADELLGLGEINTVSERGVDSADVGVSMAILQAGAVLASLSTIGLLVLAWRMLRTSYGWQSRIPVLFPWVWLGCTNALLTVGFLLSTAHYLVALQTGGRTLFSFHIAITLLSLQELRSHRSPSRIAAHSRRLTNQPPFQAGVRA